MSDLAVFLYKCRMCGGEQRGPITVASNGLRSLVRATVGDVGDGIPLTMTSVHCCPDGRRGVSDLIGYRVEKMEG